MLVSLKLQLQIKILLLSKRDMKYSLGSGNYKEPAVVFPAYSNCLLKCVLHSRETYLFVDSSPKNTPALKFYNIYGCLVSLTL